MGEVVQAFPLRWKAAGRSSPGSAQDSQIEFGFLFISVSSHNLQHEPYLSLTTVVFIDCTHRPYF